MVTNRRGALLVACVAVLLYLPSLGFGFVWDDPMLLELTHTRLQAGGLSAVLTSEFLLGSDTAHTGYFRPVVLLSLLVDDRLGGGAPWAFHLTNLLLNALASGCVVLLLQRLFDDGPSAVFGGLLFAVHPAHVEAVAFVSGRTDLWAACFVFLATLFWLRGRRGSVASWVGVSSCLVLGVLSKELAVMAVPAWLFWDLLAPRSDLKWIERNGGWLVAALVALAIAITLRWTILGSVLGSGASDAPAMSMLLPRLLTYFKLLIVPWPLNAFYTPEALQPGASVVLLAALAVGSFVAADRGDDRHPGFAGLVWMLLFLVPVLGVVTLGTAAAAERFLYIPSFGLCLAAAAMWGRLHRRRPAVALAVSGIVIAVFGGVSVVRAQVWHEQISLYTDMARSSPRAFVAHFNLGNELAKAGRDEAAEASLARAVAVAPERADAWNNLGSVRTRRGKDIEAEAAFAEAVRLKPDFVVALRNRASALVRLGRHAEALASLEGIPVLVAGDAPLLIAIGTASADAGRWDDAERALRGAMRASPDLGQAYSYLGFVYLSQDRPEEAVPLLQRAVELDPADLAARNNLVVAQKAAASRRP